MQPERLPARQVDYDGPGVAAKRGGVMVEQFVPGKRGHLPGRQALDIVDAVKEALLIADIIPAVVGRVADDRDPGSDIELLDLFAVHQAEVAVPPHRPRRCRK
jgi:hypothetical protein